MTFHRMEKATIISLSFSLLLTACGGGGSSSGSGSTVIPALPEEDTWEPGVFKPAEDFADLCENPRIGIDPITSTNYPDQQGTTTDENNWLRSMTNDLYLWYDEVPDLNPALYSSPLDYFDLLVTDELTPSGAYKDQFHFATSTEEWYNRTQQGISAGYGAEFAIISAAPPREIVVAYTQPDSPATDVGITRGAKIISVNGEPVSNGDANILNAVFFPSDIGQSNQFEVQDLGSSTTRVVTMVSENVTTTSVQNVSTISTASGNVGYITFNEHILTSEDQLIAAINQLATDNVNDLVLDLRYNGGGYLFIASQLAYMIAGPDNTSNETFDGLVFNDKHTLVNPVTGNLITPTPFYSTDRDDNPLPKLNLDRVFILTSSGTCSASEAIINGLRGVDVDVYLMGSTTCGKPYGFYEMPNCGTSYFTVMFRGENAKGFGDYADGFAPSDSASGFGVLVPGCTVADDFTHQLGDVDEAKLATALDYRAQLNSTGTATCNVPTMSPKVSGLATAANNKTSQNQSTDLSAVEAIVPKPNFIEGKIIR